MLFWGIITAISICVAGFLTATLRIPAPKANKNDQEMGFYKAQLDEINRDLARGLILAGEAEHLRTEIKRRILTLDQTASRSQSFDKNSTLILGATIISVILIGGSLSLYHLIGVPGYGNLSQKDRIVMAEQLRLSRPSLNDWIDQNPQEANLPTNQTDVRLLEQLRKTVSERPDDLRGHILLMQIEAGLMNFLAASEAQENIIRIKGDRSTIEDQFNYAEMLILSARGYISPEAEVALNKILSQDPTHEPSRYYIGLMFLQIDRPDRAFLLWRQLLAKSDPKSPWVEPIRSKIVEVALAAGVKDYILPPLPNLEKSGPSNEEIEAAGEMSGEERLAMIKGMVEGLGQRLNTEGGPPEDWARLIRSLTVLGSIKQAQAILLEAQAAFKEHKEGLTLINQTAARIGLIK